MLTEKRKLALEALIEAQIYLTAKQAVAFLEGQPVQIIVGSEADPQSLQPAA
jgi:hypothetical protein